MLIEMLENIFTPDFAWENVDAFIVSFPVLHTHRKSSSDGLERALQF